MTSKQKDLLLAVAKGALASGGISQHDRALLLTATELEDMGYLTIRPGKGLYGLTVAKCELTPDGAQWLVDSEFKHLLPKGFVEVHGACFQENTATGKG